MEERRQQVAYVVRSGRRAQAAEYAAVSRDPGMQADPACPEGTRLPELISAGISAADTMLPQTFFPDVSGLLMRVAIPGNDGLVRQD